MNGEQLQITSSSGSGVLVLHVTGCLAYDTGEQFTHYAKAALEDAQAAVQTVTVDCAGLTGIDSMGLSVLLGLRRRTDAAGAALALSNRPPRLNRFLEITGTLDYLTLPPQIRAAGDGTAPEHEADHPRPAHRNETRTADTDAPA
ncbi:STAS domain-containing protein [Streptomyces sp. NPDC050400]|uniref:STAS domain-containing protein n=1 Tax=Streptomyces sp. NPDC050400 TaxID=3365610 RepID=UPI0037976DAD